MLLLFYIGLFAAVCQAENNLCKDISTTKPESLADSSTNSHEEPAVPKIPAVFYPGLKESQTWLEQQALELQLNYSVVNVEPGYQVILLTWPGRNPSLPSIMYNSHLELIKKEIACKETKISIDLKDDTVGVLEAIRRLKQNGTQPLRTIHVSVGPEKITESSSGMERFLDMDSFGSLNVGFAVDEGMPTSELDTVHICYGEKASWRKKS